MNSHRVTRCPHDKSCQLLQDPYHRARYRHTDLPDFLIPCRDQPHCENRSSEHRKKYSHGEKIDVLAATVERPQRPSSAHRHENQHLSPRVSYQAKEKSPEASSSSNKNQYDKNIRPASASSNADDSARPSSHYNGSDYRQPPGSSDQSRLMPCHYGIHCQVKSDYHLSRYSHRP